LLILYLWGDIVVWPYQICLSYIDEKHDKIYLKHCLAITCWTTFKFQCTIFTSLHLSKKKNVKVVTMYCTLMFMLSSWCCIQISLKELQWSYAGLLTLSAFILIYLVLPLAWKPMLSWKFTIAAFKQLSSCGAFLKISFDSF